MQPIEIVSIDDLSFFSLRVLPGRIRVQNKPIELVLNEYSSFLMALPGIVGVGQGEYDGEPCVKVFAARKSPELLEQIPQLLHGYRVIVEETGEFRVLGD